MVISIIEENSMRNLSWFVLSEQISSAGGRAIRLSSPKFSVGDLTSFSIGHNQKTGSYYFYQNVRDYPRTEWIWFLLFGLVLVVVLIIMAIVGCCVSDEEEGDTVVSSDENEEFEMEECKQKIMQNTLRETTYSTAETCELFI